LIINNLEGEETAVFRLPEGSVREIVRESL